VGIATVLLPEEQSVLSAGKAKVRHEQMTSAAGAIGMPFPLQTCQGTT
jgi:hypothetical protein